MSWRISSAILHRDKKEDTSWISVSWLAEKILALFAL